MGKNLSDSYARNCWTQKRYSFCGKVLFERDLSVADKKLREAKTFSFCDAGFFMYKPEGFIHEKLKTFLHIQDKHNQNTTIAILKMKTRSNKIKTSATAAPNKSVSGTAIECDQGCAICLEIVDPVKTKIKTIHEDPAGKWKHWACCSCANEWASQCRKSNKSPSCP